MKGKTIIAVFFTALMIFSGLLILENGAQSQGHNNQVPAVSQGPKLSTFTFNYTPRTGQYWDVDFNGQVQVSSGSHITFTAPAGNYSYEILTPQGYFSGHALVKLSGVPWWYTVGSSALAGASIGFIVGGPLGALVGGIAGAIVGGILAYWFGNSPTSSISQYQAELKTVESEANNTMTGILNTLGESMSMLSVVSSLVNSSYYYFAQEMEAIGEKYLNTSFNESELAISSGVLLQLAEVMQPVLSAISYSYMELSNWGLESMAGPSTGTESLFGTQAPTLSGEMLKPGYYMLDGNNTFFYVGNLSMTWQNVLNGTTCSIKTQQTQSITTYTYNDEPGSSAVLEASFTSNAAGLTRTSMKGLYDLLSVSSMSSVQSMTDGLYLGSTWSGPVPNDLSFNTFLLQTGSFHNVAAGTSNAAYDLTLTPSNTGGITSTSPYGWGEVTYNYSDSPVTGILGSVNSILNNAYQSEKVLISELESLGIYNYSQIPGNETIPFPSWFVPSSLLNGSFNETQLYAIYVAYLESLNNTFHHEKRLTGNDSINQTLFGGFAQESGTLNLSNNYSGHKEINGTFLIEINQGKLHFQVGQKTTFTAQTPVIVINGYYGDPTYINGSLIQASTNSTFYTTAIMVNGTSEQSYTLSGQLIKVYLYRPGNLTSIPVGAFLLTNKTVEYLIIAVLVIVVLAAVIVGMGRKGHKDKKKRSN